jgi:hypothetical protein
MILILEQMLFAKATVILKLREMVDIVVLSILVCDKQMVARCSERE